MINGKAVDGSLAPAPPDGTPMLRKVGRVLAVENRRAPVITVDSRTQRERPVTAFPLVTGLFPLVWQVQGSNLRRLSRRFYRAPPVLMPDSR
ncbi:hypothetical protein GCM10009850_096180 [Nonomuraea monospora]|uniref:Uncharacterized protein n=1 Tax=Nonomuraea monospora TaxID=568818 RepID=A0ABN3CXC5_9ACTN